MKLSLDTATKRFNAWDWHYQELMWIAYSSIVWDDLCTRREFVCEFAQRTGKELALYEVANGVAVFKALRSGLPLNEWVAISERFDCLCDS